MDSDTTTKVPFGNFADAVEEAKSAPEAKYKVPLQADAEKTSMLISVEKGVKELVGSLAKKTKIEGCDIDESAYENLPK